MGINLHYAILKTLSYFDVFQYPLTENEIWKFLQVGCSVEDVRDAMGYLEAIETVYRFGNYYSLHDDVTLVERRISGNELGRKKLKKAYSIARFLGMFPFVEAVCVSGSLSKDFALNDSDVDFFIITAPGRLWTARNLMHFFRKLTFSVNAQRSFCMNYYISAEQPRIFPQNLYTAVELSTLKAACIHGGIDDLVAANADWVSTLLPNMDLDHALLHSIKKKSVLTRLAEATINVLGGDKIESWFYKTTMQRWERKWSRMNYDVYKCMLSAGPHINTPVNYPIHLPNKILLECDTIFLKVSGKYRQQHTPALALRT